MRSRRSLRHCWAYFEFHSSFTRILFELNFVLKYLHNRSVMIIYVNRSFEVNWAQLELTRVNSSSISLNILFSRISSRINWVPLDLTRVTSRTHFLPIWQLQMCGLYRKIMTTASASALRDLSISLTEMCKIRKLWYPAGVSRGYRIDFVKNA